MPFKNTNIWNKNLDNGKKTLQYPHVYRTWDLTCGHVTFGNIMKQVKGHTRKQMIWIRYVSYKVKHSVQIDDT